MSSPPVNIERSTNFGSAAEVGEGREVSPSAGGNASATRDTAPTSRVNIENSSDEIPSIPFGYSQDDIAPFEKAWAEWAKDSPFNKSYKITARFFYCLGIYDERGRR